MPAGRVESGGFEISPVGSGRVRRFSNLTGRVGSDNIFFNLASWVGSRQEAFKISRVRSGQVNIPQYIRGSGRVC